jgi:hypothetical protein
MNSFLDLYCPCDDGIAVRGRVAWTGCVDVDGLHAEHSSPADTILSGDVNKPLSNAPL